jgi:AraC-like DNA-binding protein
MWPREDYASASEIINTVVPIYDGRTAESSVSRAVVVFNSGRLALESALTVRNKIQVSGLTLECRMGIGGGPPLSTEGDFFIKARKTAERLALISSTNSILLSSWIGEQNSGKNHKTSIKELNTAEEKFIDRIIDALETHLGGNEVSIGFLATKIGMSRSQLSRKIIALTGISPHNLVNELRLRKAYRLLEQGDKNISEITLDVGLSNPSYFAKCFRSRFGFSPSELRSVAFQS